MPKVHLKYIVFLNNWSGHPGPQGRAPYFIVSLDRVLSVEKHVENGMKGVAPPVRSSGPAAGRTDHTDSMKNALEMANNLQNLLNATHVKQSVNQTGSNEVLKLPGLEEVVQTGNAVSLPGETIPETASGADNGQGITRKPQDINWTTQGLITHRVLVKEPIVSNHLLLILPNKCLRKYQ